MLGGGHEPARDRRLRGAGRCLLDAGADRLESGRVAASGELGEHPFQCELAQQIGGGECLVGRHRGSPGPVRCRGARLCGRDCGGPWGQPAERRRRPAWPQGPASRCPRPGPTAPHGRRRPARHPPGSPARAAPAARRQSWRCGGYSSTRRSPSGRASWRMPDTYHTAGLRRGPPPQLLRRPGQPQSSNKIRHGPRSSRPTRASVTDGCFDPPTKQMLRPVHLLGNRRPASSSAASAADPDCHEAWLVSSRRTWTA